MTTQSEMIVIVRNVMKELCEIASYMSKYAKLQIEASSWGSPQFAASGFLKDVKDEIENLNRLLSVYTSPNLQVIYANYDFDETVKNVRKKLKRIQKVCNNFKEYEFSSSYYPLPNGVLDDD